MRLEPRSVICQQSVSCRVRLIEAVACELLHQVEELASFVLIELQLGRASHERDALLGHLLGDLLSHRASQQVGAAERVAADRGADLHDLLLIDDDAERFSQDGLKLREHVLDRTATPLALDEVIDHTALDWPRTIECVESGEVFDGGGLVTAQNVAHAPGFKLEDARGERAMEDLLVGLRVVEWNLGHVQLFAGRLLDQIQAVVDDGQSGPARESPS